MRHIIDYASRRGVAEIFGDLLEDNVAMRPLCRSLGFVESREKDPVLRVTLSLGVASS
jgi:hypothetical protein